MVHFLKSMFVLIVLAPQMAGTAATAAPAPVTPPAIDKAYEVPDHVAKAALLLKKIRLLAQREKELRRGETPTGEVDDLLHNLFLPDNAREFRNRYARELRLARGPKKPDLWLALAQQYATRNNPEDAATAAFMAYALPGEKSRKAAALRLMGEVYADQGNLADGLNLLHKSLRLSPDDETERRLHVIMERFFLTIRDIAVNVEQASPNACIIFSKKLMPGQRAEDYVAVTGLADLDISARDNQVCLNGLEYGKGYDVTIKKGLKGENNTLLDQDSRRSFTVHDRDSRAGFDPDSYVISRTRDNVVPLTTVNVSRLDLALYLIHDRNLLNGTQYNLFENIGGYDAAAIRDDRGSLIWQGEIDITGKKNTEIRTLLPLDEMIGERQNGIYVLTAREPRKEGENEWRYHHRNKATQWLLVSDMGLMTFMGRDGLHVMVRSLETARPLKKVTVNLISRNNRILGSAVSDRNGMARFPAGLTRGTGGDAPVLITAEGPKQDYNFLKLQKSYLDLSERGIAGRTAPDQQDAFLYTDRGAYRPGETVKLGALLRDPESRALGRLPLTFKVTRPDGGILLEKTLTGDDLGGYGLDIPLQPSAISGQYRVSGYLTTDDRPLGQAAFQVEDFVPQRLRARLSSDKKWLVERERAEIALRADFLYGAPAAGLKAETRISLQANPRPYEAYRDYQFGLVEEEFYGTALPSVDQVLDDQGRAVIPVELTGLPDTTRPLLAYMQTFVFDVGGRPVDAKVALPVRPRAVEVGLKQEFSGILSEGDEARFKVVALDPEGRPVAGRRIRYELVREDYYYSWYRSGDDWRSRQNLSDTLVETGEVITDTTGHAEIRHFSRAGRYRLTVLDQEDSSAASRRYHVGWWSAGTLPNVPDALELTLKDADLHDDDRLTAFVKAPFAGQAVIMVMNDKLRLTRHVSLPKEGREISLRVDRDWGPGAYLMVSAFRPGAGRISKLPVRAMGLHWFTIDRDRRMVKIAIDTPGQVRPRQTVTLPVRLTGENLAARNLSGQKIRLTLAAVDEGILGLTRFKSPDPVGHFLSQRRLGMELADLYGRLIRPASGVRGDLRTGGDMTPQALYADMAEAKGAAEENAAGLQTRTVKTVALYQRDIELDADGAGTVTLDLPDFNGRLRLMAVAYGRDVVGRGDSDLVVRDPVIADLLLPRFLAPGDTAEARLALHNLSGEKRRFVLNLEQAGGVEIDGETELTVTLDPKARLEQALPLRAGATGDSRLTLHVSADGLPDITRHWDIAVRPAQPYVTQRKVAFLETGTRDVLTTQETAGYLPGTLTASLTVTNRPDFNVPDLLDSLHRYPYACAEQSVSRALPLLYYGEMAGTGAGTGNEDPDPLALRRKIDRAIGRVLDLQRHDGSFALWRSTGDSHPWLTAYVFEFLSRAREQDMDVPAAAYDHARHWLKNLVNARGSEAPHVQAYALYVLARIGEITPGDVRYFADNQGDDLQTRIGLGHLAAALSLAGEAALAEAYFEKALRMRRPQGKEWRWFRDFGSDLRDGAALASLMAETAAGQPRLLRIAEQLDREYDRRKYFSSQEQAWLLLATHALNRGGGAGFRVALNGEKQAASTTPLRYSLAPRAFRDGFEIENIGSSPVRSIRALRAVPATPLPPVAEGFEISRTFLTLDGREADLDNIRQNDLLVAVLQGRSHNRMNHEALIVDLLPAGFEIENAAIGGYDAGHELNFLPEKTAFLYESARDDRYVAALNLDRRPQKFATAYIVRAVTPGRYALPAPFVEDMYKPQYHARGAARRVTIRE